MACWEKGDRHVARSAPVPQFESVRSDEFAELNSMLVATFLAERSLLWIVG
jgi:hypothetical protein